MKRLFSVEVKLLSEKWMSKMDGSVFEEFLNWWNPLIKRWTLPHSLRESAASMNLLLGAPKSCFPGMNPSFFLTFGRCRFQLSWINLEWERHIKIAADTRNRCLLHGRATGLFHQFNGCLTLSKASSVSYKLQSDSDGSVTLTQRHKS